MRFLWVWYTSFFSFLKVNKMFCSFFVVLHSSLFFVVLRSALFFILRSAFFCPSLLVKRARASSSVCFVRVSPSIFIISCCGGVRRPNNLKHGFQQFQIVPFFSFVSLSQEGCLLFGCIIVRKQNGTKSSNSESNGM